jgi:hypothetical protein
LAGLVVDTALDESGEGSRAVGWLLGEHATRPAASPTMTRNFSDARIDSLIRVRDVFGSRTRSRPECLHASADILAYGK